MCSSWQQRHRTALLPGAQDSVVAGLPAGETADAAASLRRMEEELRRFNERESHVELLSALERSGLPVLGTVLFFPCPFCALLSDAPPVPLYLLLSSAVTICFSPPLLLPSASLLRRPPRVS